MNNITRRSFVKKSALTAAAVSALGSGVALATGEEISSAFWHTHKCDNSKPLITGLAGTVVSGKVEEPAGSGQYKYFPLYNCVCVKDQHPLGVHRGKYQNTDPGGIVREYGGVSEWGAVPPEHVDNHS